jgi:hypothetical protein
LNLQLDADVEAEHSHNCSQHQKTQTVHYLVAEVAQAFSQYHCQEVQAAQYSVSNSSKLHSFGLGCNWNRNPCSGQELPTEPNQVTRAALSPVLKRKPVVGGWVGTGLRFRFIVPTVLAPNEFSSSYHITTWFILK